MSYNDDAVLAKLSALNESHDSIATAAQWIMFHRRHADRTVQIWLQRLKDSSSSRRLSLIYLANEVTQQSKARNKDDFVVAFSPIVAEATATAYRGAPAEIQGKLRRVVDVWRDRSIFEPPIQAAIESRLDELEKARGTAKATFSTPAGAAAPLPTDLAPLIGYYQSVTKLQTSTKATVSSAIQDYDKLMDPEAPAPTPPVFAARLNGLLKTLANAESVATESVNARKELMITLEKVLATSRAAFVDEESQLAQLAARKKDVEDKKSEVELAIMRNLGPVEKQGSPVDGSSANPPPEPDRPEVEALTPPDMNDEPPKSPLQQPPTLSPPGPQSPVFQQPAAPGIEILSNLASQYQSLPVTTNGANKRRRVDNDDFPDLGGDDGIDEDVAEMLRRDSGGK